MKRPITRYLALAALFGVVMTAVSVAQPGGGKKGKGDSVDDLVGKLMAFDKDKDGKLTKTELTDTRLHGLFERADTKKNGYITRSDLEALYDREKLEGGPGGDKKGKGPKGPEKK